MSKAKMGWGAILLAVLIALTEFTTNFPGWLNYVWVALALIWGITALAK